MCGEQVEVKSSDVDQHGRALDEIMFAGESISKKIIQEGHGWCFYHYHSEPELGHLEVEARSARKGLFAARNPIYPLANWRAGARVGGSGSGSGGGGSSGGGAGGTTTSPTVTDDVFILGAMPNPRQVDTGKETVLIGNRDDEDASIDGWTLSDDDGGSMTLSGTVSAGGVLTVQLGSSLLLGNSGDTIILTLGMMCIASVTPVQQRSTVVHSMKIRSGRSQLLGMLSLIDRQCPVRPRYCK